MTLYSNLTRLELLAREGRAWAVAPPDRGGLAMGRVDGKVVLISGGARGQGEAEARLLAREGARVVIGDVLRRARREGRRASSATARSTSRSTSAAPRTGSARWRPRSSSFGRLDGLVNNAGISRAGSIEAMPLDDYLEVVNTNQVGCFLGMQAAIPALRRAGGGSIVNISSIAGLRGVAGMAAYCASKFAIRGMTKVAALELGHDGHPRELGAPGHDRDADGLGPGVRGRRQGRLLREAADSPDRHVRRGREASCCS